MSLRLQPIPIDAAAAFVGVEHRHSPPTRLARWCLAAYKGAQLVGVAMVGNTKARLLHEPRRQEVVRLATDGTFNACSFLYGAAARVARTMGVLSLKTYTLASEPGDSLRAVGAKDEGLTDGGEWTRPSRKRGSAANPQPKRRWELLHETAHLLEADAARSTEGRSQLIHREDRSNA